MGAESRTLSNTVCFGLAQAITGPFIVLMRFTISHGGKITRRWGEAIFSQMREV
jgi:hypothetical protein